MQNKCKALRPAGPAPMLLTNRHPIGRNWSHKGTRYRAKDKTPCTAAMPLVPEIFYAPPASPSISVNFFRALDNCGADLRRSCKEM